MKRSTLFFSALALFAGAMSAETLQVTTAEMNAATDGSLLKVMASIPDATETTIQFNLDADVLEYSTEDCTGFSLANKKVVFEGVNAKTGNQITINGNTNFVSLSSGSEVTFKNMTLSKFSGIAIKSGDGCAVTAVNCKFIKNVDPKNESGNNGGVMRLSGGVNTIDKCVFTGNKGMGSYGGGAICLYTSSAAAPVLKVTNSTFNLNEAVSGGAIAVNCRSGKGSVPEVYVANCTFANNTIANRGGAIYMQTAETSGSFAPVIVNCTFVGNINNITNSDDGGAINVWSRATTTMSPVLINNLFAENYFDPWGTSRLNDVKAFYLKGDMSGDTEQPQTVNAVVKNNLFAAAEDKFYTVLAAADNNGLVDFATDKIFAETEQNPWDEGDPEYNHKTSKLAGDMLVALVAENSIALGKGLASYEGVVIPTTDQLGNVRPAVPSVGAMEYCKGSGVGELAAGNDAKMVKAGNVLTGIEAGTVVEFYDIAGRMVKAVKADANGVSVDDLGNGLYVAKAGNAVLKFVK